MDFDLDLAVSQTNENPVFYVQYAHARISSILRLLEEEGVNTEENDFSKLLCALGIRQVGQKAAKILAKHFKTIEL